MITNKNRRDHDATYRATHRDERCAYNVAYRQLHKDETSAYRAAYFAAHSDEERVRGLAYYQENRDAILEKDAKESAIFIEWLQILRTNNGCEDCGTHEGQLLHHHIDPSTKLSEVSQMYSYSLDALEEELEKCVVLCIPCHNERHVEMRARRGVMLVSKRGSGYKLETEE